MTIIETGPSLADLTPQSLVAILRLWADYFGDEFSPASPWAGERFNRRLTTCRFTDAERRAATYFTVEEIVRELVRRNGG